MKIMSYDSAEWIIEWGLKALNFMIRCGGKTYGGNGENEKMEKGFLTWRDFISTTFLMSDAGLSGMNGDFNYFSTFFLVFKWLL